MLTIRMQDLEAAQRMFRDADAEIRRSMQREARTWAPTLRQAAMARARTEVDRRIAASGKTTITAKGVKATFGSTGRVGSTPLKTLTRPYEFGSNRQNMKTEYTTRHRVSGRQYRVKRRTKRQIPRAQSSGRFIYPALRDTTPELVSRYVRAIAEAVNGA